MSKAIEMMKEEGWTLAEANRTYPTEEVELIGFIRPKQKPNAVVDWEKLDSFLDYHAPGLKDKILENIKKTTQ